MSRIISKGAARLLSLAVCVAGLSASRAFAQTVIGDWEGGSADGWIDWGNQKGINDPAQTAGKYTYSSTTGVTHGSGAVHVHQTGFNQDLAIKLESIPGAISQFMADDEFDIDLTYPAQTQTSGFQQIYQVALNAPGFGFANFPGTSNPVTADSSSPPVNTNVGYGEPTGDKTLTLHFNYDAAKSSITLDPGNSNLPDYVEFIFATNGDSNHPDFYFDNARLVAVPEPASAMMLFGVGAMVLRTRRRHTVY